tara:strand:- start:1367 stop:2608 length:1242 start_codon:yes stop_codon:yes gene_type:complete
MPEDWHVNKDTVEFTLDHLNKHLSVFNERTQPEYFITFEHKGLTFHDVRLVPTDLLKSVGQSWGGQQDYRHVKNDDYSRIEKSVKNEGVDLRKKPLQIVVELDDNDKIVKVFKMFNGNSLNDILDKNSKLENRICAIFVKNRNYSEANMISIGTYQNNLEKPFGACTEANLKFSLEKIIENDGFPIASNPTHNQEIEWFKKVTAEISFITNKNIPESSKQNKLLNELFNKASNNTSNNRSFGTGKEVMEVLRTKRYVDTPSVLYNSFAARYVMVWPSCKTLFNNALNQDFDFENGSVEIIIHLSHPDMTKPIEWFFSTALDFWKKWNGMNEFVNPQLPINLKILGAYQPLDCLKDIWEIDSVVPFSKIVAYKGDKTMSGIIAKVKHELENKKDKDEDFENSLAELMESGIIPE